MLIEKENTMGSKVKENMMESLQKRKLKPVE